MPQPFDTLLIANRGEIACRIARTCRRLGIATVAVYSEADAGARHVREADRAYCIGGPAPADSYLRGDAIIEVARASGAQAIHPGYGFLSENADFAEQVQQAGLAFVGPSAASMRRMGSKAGAKQLMQAHGVPVVPGYTGEDQDPALLQREADRIGYPLMIKAAHGGGGKGMRIVRDAGEFAESLVSCQREAKNAFGRDRVLLERYVERPRHIEIQVFGDSHGNVLHLNERECSAQRRYQKILEESPSPFLTPELRARMGEAAVTAARAIDYVNAGTVEFIVGQGGDFHFMEINTRLQVEHPVTEMTLGLDLVEWQLRVAAGEALPLAQEQVRARGHAIEVRLYAEDPDSGFLPGSGRIERLLLPEAGPSVRIDSGVESGDTVTVHYDPMIAKLIVHADDRDAALAAMRQALAQCDVVGPKSNIAFLERLIAHPVVRAASIDTGYLDRHLDEFLDAAEAPPLLALATATAMALNLEQDAAREQARTGSDPHSPWALGDGWRLGHASAQQVGLAWRDRRIDVEVLGEPQAFELRHDGSSHEVAVLTLEPRAIVLALDGVRHRVAVLRSGAALIVHCDGRQRFRPASPYAFEGGPGEAADSVRAPMPGRVVAIHVGIGDAVGEGEPLLVMEAMKMELTLRAPGDVVVAALSAEVGAFVEADSVLVRFEVE